MLRSAVLTLLTGGLLFAPTIAPASDTLQQYSQKCLAAIGEDVPGFDCDKGQAVPEGKDNGKPYGYTRFCDFPNVLNHECDPGSKFQVLADDAKATIVAHCRTKAMPNDGKYGDIAVIQYSKVNGATCFYQQLPSTAFPRLPAIVEAPSTGNAPWYQPKDTAAIGCGECHDNGPFVRSPYLAQLAQVPGATFKLPGSHSQSFNDTEPYAFVGDDFKTWKAYKIEIAGNWCTDCHRMGVSNLNGHDRDPSLTAGAVLDEHTNPCHVQSQEGGSGTARVFGIIATLPEQCQKLHKNLHTWMIPFDYNATNANKSKANRYSKANLDAANQMRACAMKFVASGYDTTKSPIPSCTVALFAQAYTPSP
jgi:hypothetical protein